MAKKRDKDDKQDAKDATRDTPHSASPPGAAPVRSRPGAADKKKRGKGSGSRAGHARATVSEGRGRPDRATAGVGQRGPHAPNAPAPDEAAPTPQPIVPAAPSHAPTPGTTASPKPQVWPLWAKVTSFGAALAVVGGIITNVSKLGDLAGTIAGSVRVSFVTDTALFGMVGSLYGNASSRDSMLGQIDLVLARKGKLMPPARERLLSFVKAQAPWKPAAEPCATPALTDPTVTKALHIALKRRQGRRRFFVFGSRTELPAPHLNLDGANLQGMTHSAADLRNVSLIGACLRNARLQGALLDSAVLEGAILDSVVLDSASLTGAVFKNAHLRHASLEFAHGTGVVLSKARLEGASLNGAVLPGVTFRAAYLACATLAGAKLDSAVFWSARIQWAFLDTAVLTGVRWTMIDSTRLTRAFVRTAVLDSASKAWSYRNGADTLLVDPLAWTVEANNQRTNGECERLAQDA